MSSEDKFDVIIIGAGPAGSACAYILAQEGKTVLLIERGDSPGSKNVTGGRLYTYALEELGQGLYKEAALERKVTHEQIMMLSHDKSINIEYHNPVFDEEGQVPISYTVIRGKFDEWLAKMAEDAGAMLVCGIKVDELIGQDGAIIGVVAGDDEIYADMVIAADGVNSFMAQKAGLIGDIKADTVGVGLKEVIELPPQTIESRFNLKPGEGAARMILGCTEGIHGGGFLYTNEDSISLGCVFMPEEVAQHKKPLHKVFQDMKMHPSIYALIEGGETIEYSAHLVTETGYRGIPKKLYKKGFMMIGDAAGFVINTGYSIRGIDLAILSGIAAARAIIAAGAASDAGQNYINELKNIKLLPTMKAADSFTDILETPWVYDKVPDLAVGVFGSLFTITSEIPLSIKKNMMNLIKANGLSVWELIKFGYKGMKSL